MTSMYEKFGRVLRYPQSEDALFEPTVRLPYALHSPAVVTHVPLFNLSQEDFNFEAQVKLLEEFFRSRGDKLISPTPEPHDTQEIRTLISKSTQDISIRAAGLEDVIARCWEVARESFARIIDKHPEYIVFRSMSLISRDVNRDAHSSIVEQIKKSRDGSGSALWSSELVLHQAFYIVNATLQEFLERVAEFIQQFQKEYPPSALPRHSATKQDILGGIVSWMDDAEFNPDKRRSETSRRVFKLAPSKAAPETGGINAVIDRYLVWRRGEQNWRYTFYEGLYEYPDQQCASDLGLFISRLLTSSDLEKSFPSAEGLASLSDPAASQYTLPGKRIGGAQYLVIPAELVLVLLARFDDVGRICGSPSRYQPQLLTADRRNADDCIRAAFEAGASLSNWEDAKIGELVRGAALTSGADLAELLRAASEWLRSVNCKLTSESALHVQFHSAFAGMTELCWKSIYSSEQQQYGHDDFVCSRVIDDRALYFSNFRPIDREGVGREYNFTRTFFIDFGLTNYQRARLVRRLCEVATYRMSCIKDIARIRAMQDGLDALNAEFSTLVAVTAKDTSKNFSKSMELATDLYQQMLDFDLFISEGVLGRRLSSEAEWTRVRKQVTDIREKRVPGYATLTDFLERGLAAAVADIVRFAGRYENLRNRVRDHLSRMRTELSVLHTTKIVEMLEASQALASTSEELLRGVKSEMEQSKLLSTDSRKLLEKAGIEGEKQTLFLRSADTLVFVGAIYYSRSLLDKIFDSWGHEVGIGWLAVLEELAIIAGLSLLILVIRKYIDIIVGVPVAVFLRLSARIRGRFDRKSAHRE